MGTFKKTSLIFPLIASLIVAWLGNKIAYQVHSDHEAGVGPSDLINNSVNDVVSNPLHVSFVQADLIVALVCALLVWLTWAYQATTKRKWRDGREHGSAEWGTSADIRPYINKKARENMVFTRTERLNLDGRATQRNLNAMVIGSSGSGKSRYYVLPNLYQANTSFIVTDPKGELLRASGTMLEEEGYKIRCLNLVDFASSERFNPLAYFNPQAPEADCQILTHNFIANTNGRKPSTGADFWEKAEHALLNALIAYVYFTEGPQGSLVDVVDLLSRMRAAEKGEESSEINEVDALFEAVGEEIEAFEETPEAYDAEAANALEGLRFALQQYTTYTQGAGETKKSIIISLGVRMAPLHMSALRTLLGSDTIAAHKVGDEKTALFLIIPDTHATYNFLVSIFYECIFEKLLYVADHQVGGRLSIPVQCFMDEFANIGAIPSFERKIAVMRSRGLSVSPILQTYAQGKALYKDNWETIVGNCDSLLFLGGAEPSTTEFLSKRLGKETIHSRDESVQRGTSSSASTSVRTMGRELMTPDEIGRMSGEECLYLLRGLPPFKSRKLPAPQTGTYVYTPGLVSDPGSDFQAHVIDSESGQEYVLPITL